MTIVESEVTEQVNHSNIKNSSSKDEIPIQNIYYMLSYAYNNLKINQDILRESEYFENIYDLFARILIEAINSLIRRGFYKEYIVKSEDISSLKGKISISESIKRRTTIYKKLNCQYDEFSSDVLFNQIIKTTMDDLIRINVVDNKLKKRLKRLRPFFNNINSINLNKQVFKSVMYHKNNKYYTLPITICELIFLTKLPKENNDDRILFKDFIERYKNEMGNLFENFVLNFYKKELEDFKTSAPTVYWNVDNDYPNIGKDAIPNMYTDIVLKKDSKQLIIETKFYKEILKSNRRGKNRVNSNHFYQIYSYLKNSKFDEGIKEISGMLLYASIGEDINYEFKIDDCIIFVKTLDLNQDWDKIGYDLRKIANIMFR